MEPLNKGHVGSGLLVATVHIFEVNILYQRFNCISSGGSRILKRGGAMISLRWISGFWIVGEGRPLRAEFALSTVSTVTRVIARYETL